MFRFRRINSIAAAVSLLVLIAQDAGAGPGVPINNVKTLKVFFGHQSVGDNVLDGVRQLAPDLRIVRTERPVEGATILEAHIGRNGFPETKVDHFERVMTSMGGRVDVAMMKFCYVDIDADTDLDRLKRQYQSVMSRVATSYKKTRFVHITVPLTTTQVGIKATIKRLLGKPVWGERENRKRAEFNDWLRRAYANEPIFDLAAVESQTPDGQPVTFPLDGRTYPALYPSYSDDGQHLTGQGRKLAAEVFLRLLERLARERVP